MTTNTHIEKPVTAARVGSSPLLGSFALDPAHLGYAYCNAEYDHQMTGLFATAEEAEAEARIECRKGGWVSAVRSVDENDDCAEDGWDFISYGPRKEIPSA